MLYLISNIISIFILFIILQTLLTKEKTYITLIKSFYSLMFLTIIGIYIPGNEREVYPFYYFSIRLFCIYYLVITGYLLFWTIVCINQLIHRDPIELINAPDGFKEMLQWLKKSGKK